MSPKALNKKQQVASVLGKKADTPPDYTRELDELLRYLLDTVVESLEAELGSIMLLDKKSGDLLIQVARGLSPDIIQKTRQKLGTGLSGWVAATGEWLALGAKADHPELATRRDLSSAIIIPLHGEQEVLGTVNVSRKSGQIELSEAKKKRLTDLLGSSSKLIQKLRATRNLESSNNEMSRKLAITRIFNSTRDYEKLVNLALSLSLELLGSKQGFLALFEDFEQDYDSFAGRGIQDEILDQLIINLKTSLGHGWFHRDKNTLLENISELDDLHPYAFLRSFTEIRSVIVIPLLYGYRVVGRLHIFNPDPGQLADNHVRILAHLSAEAAISLEQARQMRNLEREAYLDTLTGTLSRTFWMQHLEMEIIRSRRLHKPCSVLILDIDFFKVYNDTYGHMVGDEVLRVLPGVIRECLRQVDMLGRFGGEEFVIALPDTGLEGAAHVAGRIHAAISAIQLGGSVKPITVSIGLVSRIVREETPGDLLKLADDSLLEAKRRGRNRTVYTSASGEHKDLPTHDKAVSPVSGDNTVPHQESGSPDIGEHPNRIEVSHSPAPDAALLADTDATLFKVLVIDDEVAVRGVLRRMLETRGYQVHDYGDIAAALAWLEKSECDLVLTDLHMPTFDGMEVIRRVKSFDPRLPVVVLTGYATIQTAVEAIRLGAEDYVVKPLAMDELTQCVEKAISQRIRYLNETEMSATVDVPPDKKASFRDTMRRSSAEITFQAHKLRIMEEFSRQSMEHVASALLLLDADGVILHMNKRAQELLNFTGDLPLGKKLFTIRPTLATGELHTGFQLAVRAQKSFEARDVWISAGEKSPRALVNIYISPFMPEVPDSLQYLLSLEDIFDQQVLEEDRRQFLMKFGDHLEKRVANIIGEFEAVLTPVSLSENRKRKLMKLMKEINLILENIKTRGTF